MTHEKKTIHILNKHKRRDLWFLNDYSLNPYYLCQFNYIYCYIRSSKYRENMPNPITVKINARKILEKELYAAARKNEYGSIALSTAMETWMDIDRAYKLTKKCLSVIAYYKFPVHCITKSSLIPKDLDIMTKICRDAILPPDLSHLNTGVLITILLSTMNKYISKIFESGSSTPDERLSIIQQLKEEKITRGLAFIPIPPIYI